GAKKRKFGEAKPMATPFYRAEEAAMVRSENVLSREILGCGLEVHRTLGPGLLESAYQSCLEQEFLHRGLLFESQKGLGLSYRGTFVPDAYRLDFVVEGLVIVEVKSILRWEPVFDA